MRRTLARELPAQEPGSQVTIQGWVHRRRSLAAVTFVVVRDRTGLAQVVVKDETALAQVAEYGEETVVAVTGTVTANPSAPGGVEVTGPVFEALSAPSATPPVATTPRGVTSARTWWSSPVSSSPVSSRAVAGRARLVAVHGPPRVDLLGRKP